MAFIIPVLSIVGCFEGKQEAFDNESLALLAKGRFFQASLEEPLSNQRQWRMIQDENLAKSLLRALSPITSVKIGELPKGAVDYVFLYQSGRDPVQFYVDVSENHLVYQERQYLYEGGDARQFMELANKILAAPGE